MTTLPRHQRYSPEAVRIADLIQQGYIVHASDKTFPVTYKGMAVLMACAEPKLQPPPKRVRINDA